MRRIKLTKKAVASAEMIDGKRTEYAAENDSRLRVIRNKHRITLKVEYNAFGKRNRQRIGIYPDVSLEEFKARAEAYIQQVNQSHGQLDTRMTVSHFFDHYYLPHIKAKKKTFKEDESKFNLQIRPKIGAMPISQIRTHHLQRIMDNLPQEMKPATRNRYRASLHAMMAYAYQNELVNRNPCSAIPLLPENNINQRYLSEAEGIAFINACMTEWNNPAVLALMSAYYIGLRIGNARTLRREHLSEDLSSITLLTKSGKKQTFPLSRFAQKVILHALSISSSDYLFPSPLNSEKPIGYPKAAMQRICKKAGIAVKGEDVEIQAGFSSLPISIHGLRKTFSNRVMEQTGNIYACSELLGHSSVEVTKRYLSINHDKKIDVVNLAFRAHA